MGPVSIWAADTVQRAGRRPESCLRPPMTGEVRGKRPRPGPDRRATPCLHALLFSRSPAVGRIRPGSLYFPSRTTGYRHTSFPARSREDCRTELQVGAHTQELNPPGTLLPMETTHGQGVQLVLLAPTLHSGAAPPNTLLSPAQRLHPETGALRLILCGFQSVGPAGGCQLLGAGVARGVW